MKLVKLHSDILEESLSKYGSLRVYLSGYTREGNDIISSLNFDSEINKWVPEVYLTIQDWAFNEAQVYTGKDDDEGLPIMKKGDALKFFDVHPDGFKFKVIKIVEL